MMTPTGWISVLNSGQYIPIRDRERLAKTIQELNKVFCTAKAVIDNQCLAKNIQTRCPKQACPLYAVCLAVAAFDE